MTTKMKTAMPEMKKTKMMKKEHERLKIPTTMMTVTTKKSHPAPRTTMRMTLPTMKREMMPKEKTPKATRKPTSPSRLPTPPPPSRLKSSPTRASLSRVDPGPV